MATLTLEARRLADEIDLAIAEGDARHVVELVDASRLSRDQRLRVCRELDKPPVPTADRPVTLGYDRWDRAHVLSDVCKA